MFSAPINNHIAGLHRATAKAADLYKPLAKPLTRAP